jgi:hypothetical protein
MNQAQSSTFVANVDTVNGSCTFLGNVDEILPDYTASSVVFLDCTESEGYTAQWVEMS